MSSRRDALNRIRELLGDDTIVNGNVRIIYDDTVGLFENEMQKELDFYFIPVIGQEQALFHGREEVWKISKEKMVAHAMNANAPLIKGENYIKSIFPMSSAEMVYPKKSVSSEPSTTQEEFETVGEEKLTTRDRVCVQLRVPEADSQWVTDLIKQHWELKKNHSDYQNAHLHR